MGIITRHVNRNTVQTCIWSKFKVRGKIRIGFLEFMSISLDGKFILMHVIILFTSAVVMQISR